MDIIMLKTDIFKPLHYPAHQFRIVEVNIKGDELGRLGAGEHADRNSVKGVRQEHGVIERFILLMKLRDIDSRGSIVVAGFDVTFPIRDIEVCQSVRNFQFVHWLLLKSI